jgi:hypothetical protein
MGGSKKSGFSCICILLEMVKSKDRKTPKTLYVYFIHGSVAESKEQDKAIQPRN